jgi:hypothetical protein
MIPGVERRPLKKLAADEKELLNLLDDACMTMAATSTDSRRRRNAKGRNRGR